MAVNIKSSGPKPYTILTTVKSESGSWEYEIRTSHRTGKTYCTCTGYGFRKTCKHMDAYRNNPTVAVGPVQSQAPTRRTPGTVLREELAALGITINAATATAISTRVLAAGGKSSGAEHTDQLNTANVRVIILPD